MMQNHVIETRQLTRYFGSKPAVQQVDLRVPRGGIFALLGCNGSGKTTTIRMLLGLTTPTRGSATILGVDSGQLTPEIRSRIGYLAEGHFVYGWMSVRECARFQAGSQPRWNADIFQAVIEHFDLDPTAQAKTLSRGERAGLCLALVLAAEPELLILDDPALGLDPVARQSLVEAMLLVARAEERTVLFSSHYLDDVERLADRLAIIDRGVLRVCASVEDFREHMTAWVLRFKTAPPVLPAIPGLVRSRRVEDNWHLTIANYNDDTQAVLQQLGPADIESVPLSMENAVIDYMGERRRGGLMLPTKVASE